MNSTYASDEFNVTRKTVNRTTLAFAVFAAVYIISSLLLSIILEVIEKYLFRIPYALWLLSVVPLYFIAFPILLIMLPKKPTVMRQKATMNPSQLILTIPLCYFLIISGSLIGQLVSFLFDKLPFIDASNPVNEMLNGADLIIAGIVTVIIAPIMEELIFRRLLIDRLRVGGERFAIIVSALFFGLFHGNFSQFFYAALLGLVLGLIYVKTGRVIYAMMFHMFINFFSGIIPTLLLKKATPILETMEKTGMLPRGVDLTPILYYFYYITVVIALVICGCVIIIMFRKTIISTATRSELTWRQKAALVWKNPGIYLTVGVCIILFAISMLSFT